MNGFNFLNMSKTIMILEHSNYKASFIFIDFNHLPVFQEHFVSFESNSSFCAYNLFIKYVLQSYCKIPSTLDRMDSEANTTGHWCLYSSVPKVGRFRIIANVTYHQEIFSRACVSTSVHTESWRSLLHSVNQLKTQT